MSYNTTLLENGTSPVELFKGIDIAAGGILMPLILLVTFVIMFIVFKNYETKIALVTSSAATSFLAALMLIMDFVNLVVLLVPVAVLFLSLIWLSMSEN